MSNFVGREYLAYCRRRFLQEYFPRIQECLEELSEEDVWWRPNDESNSIGNLILHLCGNVRQWIITGIGGAHDTRVRDLEFSEKGPIPKSELLAKMHNTLNEADAVLEQFDSTKFLEIKHIQLYDLTYLDAISHVVEHFAQHTAQIVYITKLRKGGIVNFFPTYFPQKESSSTR